MIQPVVDRASFAALRRARRVRKGPVTVAFVPGGPDDPIRVAYAVARVVGGAVVRNRVRRRLRAVVAELGPQLHAGAYLVGAGPAARHLPFGELKSIVGEALADVAEARG